MKNKIMKLQLFGADEDEVVNTLSELDLEYKHLSAEQQLEIAKIAQLRRIAGSLEGINAHLNELEDIMNLFVKCVRYIPSRYEGVEGTFSILISGSVDVGA